MHDGVGSNRHTDGPSCGDDEVLICLSKQDRVYVTQNTRLSDVKKNLVYDFKYTGLLYLVTSNSNIKTTRDLYCTLWIDLATPRRCHHERNGTNNNPFDCSNFCSCPRTCI